MTDKAVYLRFPLPCEDPEQDQSCRWYHGDISRAEAEEYLMENGGNGSFLVRASQSHAGDFVLSVLSDDEVIHIRIQSTGNYFDLGGGQKYETLTGLIDSLTELPGRPLRGSNGDPIKVKFPLLSEYPTAESWFYGVMSAADAETCLMKRGADGSFFVRASPCNPDDLVLAVRRGIQICHVKIRHKDQKYDVGGSKQFETLVELIQFYRDNALKYGDSQNDEVSYSCIHEVLRKDNLEESKYMELEDKRKEKYKRNMSLFREIFTRATSSGQKEELLKFLEDSCTLELRSFLEDNASVFHDACRAGFLDVVHILLNYGADINSEAGEMTPLQEAAALGNLPLVKYLLYQGAEVSREVWRETSPFFLASLHGHYDVILELTEHCPSFDNMPENINKLLCAACKGGNLDIVKFWYQPQTDLDLPVQQISSLENCENMTPLYAACEGRHLEVARFLVDSGVTISGDVCAHFPEITAHLVHGCFHQDRRNKMYFAKMSGLQLSVVPAMWFEQYGPKLTALNLSDNKLKSLPSVIPWGLPSLQNLNLSKNRLQVFNGPEATILCKDLKKIDLSNNLLWELCVDLFCLQSLTSMDLSTNKLCYLVQTIHDIESKSLPKKSQQYSRSTFFNEIRDGKNVAGMWDLPCLTHLNVSNNSLVVIPEDIHTCHALTHLDARDNKLKDFTTPWKCPLRFLDLSCNSIGCFSKDAEAFWNTSLMDLHLQNNQLKSIGESIVKLRELRNLDVSTNRIVHLPKSSIWECRNLESLNLGNNELGVAFSDGEINRTAQFSPGTLKNMLNPRRNSKGEKLEFPKMLSQCLRKLILRNNNLDNIPQSVCSLYSLVILDMSQNPLIMTLPRELGLLTQCGDLRLTDTNIRNVDVPDYLLSPLLVRSPNPVTKSATSNLLEHLRRLKRKYEQNKRLKMVVYGPQEKGKSTLINLLQGKPVNTCNNDNKIQITEWRLQQQKLLGKNKPEILFNVWELPGHPDVSIIDECFLTQNTLYLLVFDLRKDCRHLQEWLYLVNAVAHENSVILVGTFCDMLGPRMIEDKCTAIQDIMGKFPIVRDFQLVSCTSKAGITDLKKVIYKTGIGMKSTHSSQNIFVNIEIPESYRLLMEKLELTRTALKKLMLPPVLTEEGFYKLLEELPDNEVIALDDVNNALQYLVEVGHILHYNEQLEGLNSTYFLDPVWLQEVLMLIVKDTAVPRPVTEMSQMTARFEGGRYPSYLRPQCLQILKMFWIAVERDNGNRLLIPSKLPKEQPMIRADINENLQTRKIYRLYKVNFIPPGLWNRFIILLLEATDRLSPTALINTQQATNIMARTLRRSVGGRHSILGLRIKDKDIMYWREGMRVAHGSGYYLVESVKYHIPGSQDLGIGILITIASSDHDGLSAMGVVVDELDDILRDYFPGFQDFVDTFPAAYAVCPLCYKEIKDDSGIIIHVDHFEVQTCALAVLSEGDITCPQRKNEIKLDDLVPEMLFKELPRRFSLDNSRMTVSDTPIGSGAAGAVFPGKYGETDCVIKVYHKVKPAGPQVSGDSGTFSLHSLDSQDTTAQCRMSLTSFNEANTFKAYKAFSEVRKEVAVLSKLRHPCIVTFFGLSVRPDLYIAMELAGHGSLRDVLDKETTSRTFSKFTDKQKTYSCVFSKDITFKIIFQVGKGLEYLHGHSITYRDLKSDNVLVCSLNVNDAVNVKLSDYGISKFSTTQGLSGLVGTLGYMAPEVMNNQTYTEKVDIFSFSMLMYEVLCGQRPYHDCMNVKRALVKEKERPDIKNFNIVSHFPYLENLMSVCWDHDARKRLSAADITKHMRHHQFVCQHEVVSLPEPEAVFSDVTCVAVISEYDQSSKNRNHEVWVWEAMKEDMDCRYSICNLDTSSFCVLQNPCPGASVRCMQKIDKYLWVGNEDCEMKVFTDQTPWLTLCEHKFNLRAVPTTILFYKPKDCGQDSLGHVFVGLDNGAVAIFSHELILTTVTWKLVKTLTLSTEQSVSAMILVRQGRELWVACGYMIMIVSTETFLKEDTIDLTKNGLAEKLGGNPQIQQLVCAGDIVWCSFLTSSKLMEYDADTRQNLHSLDMRTGDLTSDYHRADEAESGEEAEDTVVCSMLAVDDTLWIGTNNGTIIVVGFKDHPRMKLAKLESVSGHGARRGSVYMLLTAGSLVVSGARVDNASRVETELVAWEAAGSERLGGIGRLVDLLKEYDKAVMTRM